MEKPSSRPINTIARDCIAVRLMNRAVTNCYNEALILGPGSAESGREKGQIARTRDPWTPFAAGW
jgi:hypothetical protein